MGDVVRFFTTGFPLSSVGVDHLFSFTGGTRSRSLAGGLARSRFVECSFRGIIWARSQTAACGGRPRNDQKKHRDVRGRAHSYLLRDVQLHFLAEVPPFKL